MNYSAGDLDQRITIEKKSMARDGAGGATATWSTRATVWAKVEPMTGRGFRYVTVQVWDVDGEHAGIVERGGAEGRPPITLGTTARISFVRDPDGNWIEVSQRASLTGPLPG